MSSTAETAIAVLRSGVSVGVLLTYGQPRSPAAFSSPFSVSCNQHITRLRNLETEKSRRPNSVRSAAGQEPSPSIFHTDTRLHAATVIYNQKGGGPVFQVGRGGLSVNIAI